MRLSSATRSSSKRSTRACAGPRRGSSLNSISFEDRDGPVECGLLRLVGGSGAGGVACSPLLLALGDEPGPFCFSVGLRHLLGRNFGLKLAQHLLRRIELLVDEARLGDGVVRCVGQRLARLAIGGHNARHLSKGRECRNKESKNQREKCRPDDLKAHFTPPQSSLGQKVFFCPKSPEIK